MLFVINCKIDSDHRYKRADFKVVKKIFNFTIDKNNCEEKRNKKDKAKVKGKYKKILLQNRIFKRTFNVKVNLQVMLKRDFLASQKLKSFIHKAGLEEDVDNFENKKVSLKKISVFGFIFKKVVLILFDFISVLKKIINHVKKK